MNFIVDCGNIERIKKVSYWLPMDGISINPSLAAKEDLELFALVRELLDISNGVVHVQVLANSLEKIVAEAKQLHEIDPTRIIVKIPVTEAGFAAMKELQDSNIRITATAVFSIGQALTAAKLGAYCVAPYVSRIDRAGGSGINLARQLSTMLRNYEYKTKLIAASVKTLQQVNELIDLGIDGVALEPELYKSLIEHSLTDRAMVLFEQDWKKRFMELSIHAPLTKEK